VRHGDQFELAVVDAEDVVAVEIQAVDVAADLLVGRGVAEAQVAVVRVQRQQVRRDPATVAGPSERIGTTTGLGFTVDSASMLPMYGLTRHSKVRRTTSGSPH
jgi:hypothetical protein